MRQIAELEKEGFTFSVVDGKLKYQYEGEGLPDKTAALLLNEIKTHKVEAIGYLQSKMLNAEEAIKLAWAGKLQSSCLIAPRQEYRNLWNGPVWLCPTDKAKEHIRKRYPNDLALSAKEFFQLCESISNGENVRSVIEAARLFGGSLEVSA